ncbi:MAG TPA: choice-of-anchor tandem repeat NxxGxxAF-containing protein [Planctomycetota bacterium]|nr:choice-of-anchor tandem repeat NxxGxxAF-containing protein [Planctomycetota bacterium]
MLARTLPVLVLQLALAAQGSPFVRLHDTVVRRATMNPSIPTSPSASLVGGVTACATLPVAWHSQTVPGGGTLSPIAPANPACVNRPGAFAFVANVNGNPRNQGVFVVDALGLRAIATGCGQGGGSGMHGTCGDPAPGGGTFAGFFGGTVFAPPINDEGDVLFFADVVNGPTTRGLFLYLAASATIIKVAGVGDPSPLGGIFGAIGPGSLNNHRTVAFLASPPGTINSNLFLWQGGTVTKIAAAGDPAPGGGTIALLGTEAFGYQDGTNIPSGPVPAINDCGQVAYRVIVNGGPTTRGIVVRTNGLDVLYLRAGDPTPAGGTYTDFQAAALNGSGQIAVFADYTSPGGPTSGWFTGSPGSFRKALAFFDPVDGGSCLGLAYSRNPMTPLDDEGNLVLWCDTSSAGGQDRLVVSAANGTLTVLARRGDPTPLGGTYTGMNAWPSLSSTGHATLSAYTPGAPGIFNAHFASVLCGPAIAASQCTPVGGTIRIDDYGPGGGAYVMVASTTTTFIPLPPWGTLLIGPSPLVILAGPVLYPGSSGPSTTLLPIPPNPQFVGVTLHFQTLAFGSPTDMLTNRASTRLQ